jgi:hypothetical protein
MSEYKLNKRIIDNMTEDEKIIYKKIIVPCIEKFKFKFLCKNIWFPYVLENNTIEDTLKFQLEEWLLTNV